MSSCQFGSCMETNTDQKGNLIYYKSYQTRFRPVSGQVEIAGRSQIVSK